MSTPRVEGRAVNCPKCRAQIGTTPDGKSLRAGKGAVLHGPAVLAHMGGGTIPEDVKVGCLACGQEFTAGEARQEGQTDV